MKQVVVHKFHVANVEDPDIYAADPLLKWQESEAGKWVMEHAVEQPVWHRHSHSHLLWGYNYIITARLTAKDYTFWTLKWGSQQT